MKRLIEQYRKWRGYYRIPRPATLDTIRFLIEKDLPSYHLKKRPVRTKREKAQEGVTR